MAPLLVLVHTVPSLVQDFGERCAAMLPGVRVLHILDEPLLERIRRRGYVAPEDEDRLAGHIAEAEALGADAVLVTCSTVSVAVDAIRNRCRVPVVAIDAAMAAEAVREGERIGIVATNPTTLEPSSRLIEVAAAAMGRHVVVHPRLVEDALSALLSGDTVRHDRMVLTAVHEEAASSDVVVLAQASMARVLPALEAHPIGVPVLASPVPALREVGRILGVKGRL
jgi:Asp/Glu/hydantoin racemase